MKTRPLLRSFAGGEITPELFARLDLSKFQTGLAKCLNFWTLPHGPAQNRPGFEYVRTTKNSAVVSRLIPFAYNTLQTFAIELGAGYFRFHTQGATLLVGAPAAYNGATTYAIGDLVSSGGVNYYSIQAGNIGHAPPNAAWWYALPATGEYEIPNGYAAADLFNIHYTQSADVLTLVHPGYAPMELRRLGATTWTFTAISFVPTISAPAAPAVVATGAGAVPYTYVTTALAGTTLEESYASPSAAVNNDITIAGNYNTITPAAVAGAVRYNIYRLLNGLYGYIGQTDGSAFKDSNYAPDVSKTPAIPNTPFTTDWPGAVGYFEQRRIFAGTLAKPQNTWMTRSATESNLSYSIPTRDDDSISFRMASRDANAIRHIVPLNNLVLLTSGGEWKVVAQNSDILTPASAAPKQEDAQGANNVQPIITGKIVLYAQAAGGRVRQMNYTWQAQGYVSDDVSVMAPHLFDNYTIIDMAYVKAPHKMAWFVRSDGYLLGLTFLPEQQVIAWHQHNTQGSFESVCAVSEGAETALYAIINRTVNGSTVRYVERMHSRRFTALADAFFIDAGVTYSGAPATVIGGGLHLIGKTVSILADGAVCPQQVVSGAGTITLDQPASKVSYGLPITADLQTLPLVLEQLPAMGAGFTSIVNKAWLRLDRSSGVYVGPSFDKLLPLKQRTTEPYGSPPSMMSGVYPITVQPDWTLDPAICIRQSDPLPVSLLSMALEVPVGG